MTAPVGVASGDEKGNVSAVSFAPLKDLEFDPLSGKLIFSSVKEVEKFRELANKVSQSPSIDDGREFYKSIVSRLTDVFGDVVKDILV